MKLSLVSLLFLGLVAAAPAPIAAPAPYDRRLPSRRGEPPAKVIRRDVDVDVAKPTGTGIATATAPLKTAWPTSAGTGTAPAPKPTGTGVKAILIATGTAPPILATGAPGTVNLAKSTLPVEKSTYNFPAPTTTRAGKRAAEPTQAFWWVQN
ncbi:hypothetical protein SEUCBS139899_003713 [Sporothrix eucalyptigena]|uniref:Uncharacterized protein n=1 Tax=Sporothrix eucalyptigena TaxID=1812306 RepID=A0ABP0BRN0_9PEZI